MRNVKTINSAGTQRFRITMLLIVLCSLLLVICSCSFGGDVDAWRNKALEENKVTVIMNLNYTDAPTDTTAKINKGGKLSAAHLVFPSRDGFYCGGWFSAASGGAKITTDTVFYTDTTIFAQWTTNIPDPPIKPVVDFTTEWLVLNLKKGTLNASTTTTLSANAQKRYVIFNNEPLAMIDASNNFTNKPGDATTTGDWLKMRDSTIVYKDQPIIADRDNFKPYGIEARVRISGLSTTSENTAYPDYQCQILKFPEPL